MNVYKITLAVLLALWIDRALSVAVYLLSW